MDMTMFALSWTPVLLLTVLAVFFRRPALELAIYSTIFTAGLVATAFATPIGVILLAGLDGILTTLPLILVIVAGIMLSTLLMHTGSLQRIVTWFMGGVRDGFHRSLLITLGVGNFLEGAGVIAEPAVAPMLHSAGVGPAGAAALSIVGYAGLMTLEMGGIVITVLALVTGIPVADLAPAAAWLSIPAVTAMALSVPLFLPRPLPVAGGWLLAGGCGAAAGLVALGVVLWLDVTISGMVAGLAVCLLLVLIGTRRLGLGGDILADLAPFLVILASLLTINIVAPLRDLALRRLILTMQVVPVHTITYRPFYEAYIYLFLGVALAAVLFRVRGEMLRQVVGASLRKAWRAALAMGLFGAMGQIIAYSGYGPGFANLERGANLPWVMAQGLIALAGNAYPLFVPLLGWVGTFLTGYGVASLLLFGQLQVQTAGIMGLSATWLAAGLAVGTSLGSISSPFKIALAAPMCGAMGQEGAILRYTIPLGVAASLLIGLVLWLAV